MDISTLRHSCSHIMAQAVKELWPEVKLGIGPATEEGFYYDFDRKEPFSSEDLEKIEKRMQEIINENLPFVRQELSKEQAKRLFKELNEDYKLLLLEEIPEEIITVYKTGDRFIDLCRGPHVESTGQIRAFKLLSVAGAYWHGIETNPMLQRIYGTCFENQEELYNYLNNLEEAKKRDHRKLGPELEIFDIFPEVAGSGLVFYYPKGAILRTLIEDYLKREHLKRGYQLVITPHIMQGQLWKISGHLEYYRENMYIFSVEDKDFVVKPMNCPGHILIYKSKIRSYRELPLRLFELGTVYRYEKIGVLHGLLRVRGFTQDDSHIFCSPEQIHTEIEGIIDFVFETMRFFGFSDYEIELSTRPQSYIGKEEDWRKATTTLETVLKERNLEYKINAGEGAFYGPKIDIKLKDALKRKWQCATIQCDFALPERFELKFVDREGKEKTPIMLHRVILGSLERFIGTLIEHYKGDFPFWLAPSQIRIIPIKEELERYALKIKEILFKESFRVDIDLENETLNRRIRNAELEKIPYVLIIGAKEKETQTVSVRKRHNINLGNMHLDDFIQMIKQEN